MISKENKDLAKRFHKKNYFIVIADQNAQFFQVFTDEKITRIQEDNRYCQCSHPCHDEIYYNKGKVFELGDKIVGDTLPNSIAGTILSSTVMGKNICTVDLDGRLKRPY